MSVKEPYIALGVSAVWIVLGGVYLAMNSKSRGKEILLSTKPSIA